MSARTRVLGVVVACLVGLVPSASAASSRVAPPSGEPLASPGLANPRPCNAVEDFTCSTLRVPLDHDGARPGMLRLRVAAADNADAPRGVLLFLTGGPGQPGVALAERVQGYFDPQVLEEYQLVVLDQRGTGRRAIDCPRLQRTTGGSDFLTPSRSAVRQCARIVGRDRDFYGTPDTVADIELLRRALGVRMMALDGISYGSFTAAHYALAYPHRVSRLVLDSVVPHFGFDPLETDGMRATGRVLRTTCAEDPDCDTDPVADLAWVVRNVRLDGARVGPRLLESLGILSLNTVDPTFAGVPELLHDARLGDTSELERFLDAVSSIGAPAEGLSAGLHLATLCVDLRFPWGDASAPRRGRGKALDEALRSTPPAEFLPYDKATARRTLPVVGCRLWPRAEPSEYAGRLTVISETLILAGRRDLFTPVVWARRQAAWTRNDTLLVVDDAGHGVQTSQPGREATTEFLIG